MVEPLKVILNDRVLFRPLTGVGHYVRQLLDALRKEAAVEVHPFLSAMFPTPRRRQKPVRDLAGRPGVIRCAGRNGSGWARGVLLRIHASAFRWRARGYRLYHEPNHIPIACHLPTVTTIHDLSVLLHPEWHPDDRVRWYEREFDAGRRQTCRFIAASAFTKRELVSRLGVSPDVIDVTYQAPQPTMTPRDEDEIGRLRAAYRLPEQFFLYVGTLEPRKNVGGLLEAFAALPRALRRGHPLVLAGGWGWKTEALSAQIAAHGLEDETQLLGYVGDELLPVLYSACTALVWPTFYEGFGLPPLEALACGCPAIVSNVTSLPEVVGDAGVLLDPHNTAAWTEAMRRMAEDADWRATWRRRGVEQAGRFSWQRCARETIACYLAALRSV